MFGEHVTLGQAVLIALFSITAVFLVLLAISLLIELTAKVVNRKKQEPQPLRQAEVIEAAEENEADDSGLNAAIAAAVAVYLNKAPGTFIVRSITPVETESDWSRLSRSGALR